MGLLSDLFRLRPRDRRLLVRIWLLTAAVRGALFLLPFKTVRKLLNRMGRPRAGAPLDDPDYPKRWAWAIEQASHWIPGRDLCLTQALTLELLMKRRGYPARIHYGVKKDGSDALKAHAWLESDGETLIGGAGVEEYMKLNSPGSSAP